MSRPKNGTLSLSRRHSHLDDPTPTAAIRGVDTTALNLSDISPVALAVIFRDPRSIGKPCPLSLSAVGLITPFGKRLPFKVTSVPIAPCSTNSKAGNSDTTEQVR